MLLCLVVSGLLQLDRRPDAVRVRLVTLPRGTLPQTEVAAVEPPAAVERPPATAAKRVAPPKPWRARSAAEIRNSAPLTPLAKRPPVSPVARDEIAKHILSRVKSLSITPTLTGPERSSVTGQSIHRYYDVVGTRLHQMWRQPSGAEVGGGRPRVTASISVLPDGRVVRTRLLAGSGNAPMDASVSRVLKQLDRLPPFRDYGISEPKLEITIEFELD